jgi:lysophospholipase L1-like esterase
MRPSHLPAQLPSRLSSGAGREVLGGGWHPLAVAYAAALGATPAAGSRISAAFTILEQGGILDELVDGAYYGTDGNLATGAPLSLRGVAATGYSGTFTRNINGLTQPAAGGNNWGVSHAVASTAAGTLLVENSPLIESGFAGVSPIISIGRGFNASGFLYSYEWDWNGVAAALIIGFENGSGDFTAYNSVPPFNTSNTEYQSRHLYSRSRTPRIHAVNFGDATSKVWVDGGECTWTGTPLSSGITGPFEQVTLFSRPTSASAFINSSTVRGFGTTTSWLLFNRTLTTAEVRTAVRAMRALRWQPINLVIEGDSTAAENYYPGRGEWDWGHQLSALTGWDQVRRINCAMSGAAITQVDNGTYNNYATQCAYHRPRDFVRRGIFAIQGGINDCLGAIPAATIHAAILALAAKAKADGFETLVITQAPPTVGVGGWTSGMATALAAANTLLVASHAAGAFDYLVRADVLLPHDGSDDAKWLDSFHPNNLGNADVAAAIAATITL